MSDSILTIKILALVIAFASAIAKEIKSIKESEIPIVKVLPTLFLIIGLMTAIVMEVIQADNNKDAAEKRSQEYQNIITNTNTSINKLNSLDSASKNLADTMKIQLNFQKRNNDKSDEILQKNVQIYNDKQKEIELQLKNYDKRLYYTFTEISGNYSLVTVRYNFRGIDSTLRFEKLEQIVSSTLELVNSELENPILLNSHLFLPYWESLREKLLRIELDMGMTQTSLNTQLQEFQFQISSAFREFSSQIIYLKNKSFRNPSIN